MVLWVGMIAVSLHWWGEFIPPREGISAEQSHDVSVPVFVFFQFLVCASHQAKYLMLVITKPEGLKVPFGPEKEKTLFPRNVSRKKTELTDCLVCLTVVREVLELGGEFRDIIVGT